MWLRNDVGDLMNLNVADAVACLVTVDGEFQVGVLIPNNKSCLIARVSSMEIAEGLVGEIAKHLGNNETLWDVRPWLKEKREENNVTDSNNSDFEQRAVEN